MDNKILKLVTPKGKSSSKAGILNDIHWPYEGPAYHLALKVFKEIGIDILYLNGDAGEFVSVMTHVKSPLDEFLFVNERDQINRHLNTIQEKAGCKQVVWLGGNHEHRLARCLALVAPMFYGLGNDIETQFRIKERDGFSYIGYFPRQLFRCGESNLWLRHEPLASGMNHALNTAKQSVVDIAYGHLHQHQVASHKKMTEFGKDHTNYAYCLGWQGNIHSDKFNYRGSKDNWVSGFTIVEWVARGFYRLEFIHVMDRECYYRGKVYKV